MKKYKLNKDNTQPSDDTINRYKDFGKVSHRFESLTRRPKPLYKNPKVFLALVLIALLAWLLSSL